MTSGTTTDLTERSQWSFGQLGAKALAEYVFGHPRAEAGIAFALCSIPPHARRILDVGCGVGWSSWEIKRHFPAAYVLGIDPSRKLTSLAGTLFDANGLEFSSQDAARSKAMSEHAFDAIVVLDGYEHIPRAWRENRHEVLDRCLSPDGIMLMACPGAHRQEDLCVSRPDEVQAVDEEVVEADLRELADDLNGSVAFVERASVGQADDYNYAVISRASAQPGSVRRIHLEPRHQRAERARSRLSSRVMQPGLILPDRSGPTVCVATSGVDAYTQTFVRAHIEHLPARIRVLYGGIPPRRLDDGTSLRPPGGFRDHLRNAVHRRLLGSDSQSFGQLPLRQFLRTSSIDVVLAEFGQMGVSMTEVCHELGLPLVVHFHGYDAYRDDVLEQWGSEYPRLFEVAAAIIAVSRHMEAHLLDMGAPRHKLHHNSCGVDVSQFKNANPVESEARFIAVGRFVDKKGPVQTLLAFRRVLEEVPEAQLVMIGDGYLLEACRQLATGLHIEASVDFRGRCSHREVGSAMRQARAFVQHSVCTSSGDMEGTPVAILEACASGLPVVSTHHVGIPDAVIDGETGLLVSEGDVSGMSERMINLARDPALAGELGRAARARVVAEFSMEKSIGKLWRIIETVINNG
ncbi:glycosyltransferase [Chloroflexota bacterium]